MPSDIRVRLRIASNSVYELESKFVVSKLFINADVLKFSKSIDICDAKVLMMSRIKSSTKKNFAFVILPDNVY